jgi:hypothetical protein
MTITSPFCQILLASALVSLTSAFLTNPPSGAPYDPNTVQDCSYWTVAQSSDTCSSIASYNALTISQLVSYVRTSR